MKLLALVFMVVAGCTAEKQDPRYAQPAGDDPNYTECHEENVTGSNIPRTVCRPKQKDMQQDDLQKRMLENPNSRPTGRM